MKPKQTRYTTAFCPEINYFVGILDAVQQPCGKWIYKCDCSKLFSPVWYWEHELERFVI